MSVRYCEDCYAELPPRKQGPQNYCADCRRLRWRYESEEQRCRRLLIEALDELFPYGLTDDCPFAELA